MSIELNNPQIHIRNLLLHHGAEVTEPSCVESLLNFLDQEDPSLKAAIAIQTIERLINPHQKPALPETLQRLYHFEEMLRRPLPTAEQIDPFFEVQRKSRDHVIHALNTYLLGLLLVRELNIPAIPGFSFQWKITSLFHDIGYPFEIAQKLVDQSVVDPLNTLVNPDIRGQKYLVKYNFSRFKTLTTKEKSLDLMQVFLQEQWGLTVKAQSLYANMLRSGKLKHGVVSSLLLMAHIDLCYKKNNPSDIYEGNDEQEVSWSRRTFRENIIPACAAIMLHDAHKTNFDLNKIDKDVAPLPWLLRVCDALQDWDRPRAGSRQGITAENYLIGIHDGFIDFRCPLSRVKSIWEEDLDPIKEKCMSIHIAPNDQ
ncbi:hypothetical protein M1B72_11820 [Geomonas paludis]|uniref:HD domain-containing protein n=1 Tax=Geomonas paludis TaxID=2740185 RepID=A0A6V8MVA5_9BACT|nr:hypothetical protein [Geomonas paludis]UPU34141.1 hypothetical protein M1B72_11820 [Geomonas paludis]GFO64116.1 hypothetical protein GMPD_20350 [Geomonas paludis]